jgi:hypothetical protein
MNKLFGPAWEGSPIANEAPRVATPVGEKCIWCDEPIAEGDSGIVLPYIRHGKGTWVAQHHECELRQMFGSVGHQMCRCSCYGGEEEDPVGMSRREAAKAAVELMTSSARKYIASRKKKEKGP